MRDGPAPSWADIAAMMAAMTPKQPTASQHPAEAPVSKWLLGIFAAVTVTFLGGLGTYAGSTIAGVGSIGPKIDAIAGSLADLKKTVDTMTQQSNAQQIALGKQDLRITTLEQNQARLLDRMRTVEGGQRIAAPAPGSVPAQ